MLLYLSGCENAESQRCSIYAGSKNLLFSNYHRGNNLDVKGFRDKGLNIMMDSGLFTMMFGAGKDKKYTEQDLWVYMEQYIKEMHQMEWYGTIVEMDVHKVLGVDKLGRFRDYFKKNRPLERTLFVFHIEEGVEGLKILARTCPYIALSVPELRILYGNRVEKAVSYFLGIINKENPACRVHLLGCTQMNLLKRRGYYSCDSSSWLMGTRFGNVYNFKDGELKQIPYNFKKMHIDKLLQDKGLQTTGRDYLDVNVWNGHMFVQMENYINRIYYSKH